MTAADVLELLAKREETLAVAESCTGGLLGGALTAVPGCSRAFLGGVVAYADALKRDILRVPQATLEGDGAVSEATARAMVRGVRNVLDADWGLAVTGVAGPTGSEEKPPGTVWVAVGRTEPVARLFHFAGDRAAVRRESVEAALQMLLAVASAKRS